MSQIKFKNTMNTLRKDKPEDYTGTKVKNDGNLVKFKSHKEAMEFGDFLDRLRGIAAECEKLGVKEIALSCAPENFDKVDGLAKNIERHGREGRIDGIPGIELFGMIFWFKKA